MWARYRIAGLEGDYDVNRAEIRRLGKAFGLVTRETSLIVLDRIEDYVRYEIVPPAELMAAYQNLRACRAARQRRPAGAPRARREAVRGEAGVVEPRLSEGRTSRCRSPSKDESPRAELALPLGALADARRACVRRKRRRGARAAPPRPADRAGVSDRRKPAGACAVAREAKPASANDDAGTAVATIQLRKWTPDAPYIARLREADAADALSRLSRRAARLRRQHRVLPRRGRRALRERPDRPRRARALQPRRDGPREPPRAAHPRLSACCRRSGPSSRCRCSARCSSSRPRSRSRTATSASPTPPTGSTRRRSTRLHEVVVRPWHGRFPEVELITLAELNAIVATSGADARRQPHRSAPAEEPAARPARRAHVGRRQHRHRPVGDRSERREGVLRQPPDLPGRAHVARLHRRLRPGGVLAEAREARQVQGRGALLRPPPADRRGRDHASGQARDRLRHREAEGAKRDAAADATAARS